ncbi:MAG: hypothetical protein IJY57_02795 [Clostridia bacterium]|nr:hypothetical protein [Clostridia bacterium]
MKYKVIGWTFYEDSSFPNVDLTFAARHAIVDEIKEKGYLFSGYDHQEASYGVPVLNDGKRRVCSQRGFGDIMAEAHGETDIFAYSRYAFGINRSAIVAPKASVDLDAIKKKSQLCERFTLPLDKEKYDSAIETKTLVLDDLPLLRYLEKGDKITLVCDKEKITLKVIDANREKDFTKEERLSLFSMKPTEEENRKRIERINSAKIILTIKFK